MTTANAESWNPTAEEFAAAWQSMPLDNPEFVAELEKRLPTDAPAELRDRIKLLRLWLTNADFRHDLAESVWEVNQGGA